MQAQWLSQTAKSHPHALAVGYGVKHALTYQELALSASKIAGFLHAKGFKPQDRIAIFAKNSVEYMQILYGIWWGGFAAIPINYKLHDEEVKWILDNAGAKFCFTDQDFKQAKYLQYDALPLQKTDPESLAWLFYTSGTTGKPKGAMLSHANLAAASYAYMAEVDEVKQASPILHAAPMSHGSGLYIMAHVLRGGINVIPESGGFDPFEIAELTKNWQNPSMFAAPTMIKRMVESSANFGEWRTIIWGGAPMYVEDILKTKARFPNTLAQIYGQGESPMTITTLSKQEINDSSNEEWLNRLASAGKSYGMIDTRVVRADGEDCQIDETGEIIAKGAPVMMGYWNNEEATAKSLKNGYLYTGDLGAFDKFGYLTLKDRSKDVIISGGSNIYPREVEEVLLKHPHVQEVSVIGRKDADWGEVIIAYVVGTATKDELDTLCLNHIARFKRPKDYVFIESLPKNNYGKILKTNLREMDKAFE